ncbi:MAG: cysteine desulfurase [Deltaproteobacteria bacterium]|nr:cysteine desulfurase [Deltaproteobacteria bacterium]
MPIYLDHNATTPPDPSVVQAVSWAMAEVPGNPSTLYGSGRRAKELLDAARSRVAKLVGARDPFEVVFTSGGTEGDNLALGGVCRALVKKGDHLVTTMAEHKAVLRTCTALEAQGFHVTYLPVDRLGRVDPEDVRRSLTPRTVLVSVILANNEVGTVNPLWGISAVCREAGVLLHTDGVQACGKLPVDVEALGVDLLTLSGHKFHGPRGIGALWVRSGTPLVPLLHGGTQERGLRPGTENVPGAHGLGVAAELAAARLAEATTRVVRTLRDRLWAGIREAVPGVRHHGDLEAGLPNTLNVSIPGREAEALVLALDREGVEAGTGSACTTGQTIPSHVLLAMGAPPREARSSLRFSLGRDNTAEEVEVTLGALSRILDS